MSAEGRAERPVSGPSVVVLTYNSAASLSACLASLQPQVEQLGGELVVVDNASSDATLDVARSAGVEPVSSGANLGFAAGCNLGARRTSGDLLVFVNPDTIVDPGALNALVAATKARRRGPVGGRARTAEGSYDRRSALGVPSLWGAVTFASGLDKLGRGSARLDPEHGPRHVPDDTSLVPVGAVSGAMIGVPRELWEQLGGFEEAYFLYGEDVDLSLRATGLGWQPTLVADAGYHHIGGVSSAATLTRDVLLYRGKVELYRRHLARPSSKLAIVALQVGTFARGVPAVLPFPRLCCVAVPWWELFRARDQWRRGYGSFVRPGVSA